MTNRDEIVIIDWDEYVKQDPDTPIAGSLHLLSPEKLDKCAEEYPALAIRFASERLTPERLDWCAERHPATALEYTADRLSPERLDWCARQCPWAALYYVDKIIAIDSFICPGEDQYLYSIEEHPIYSIIDSYTSVSTGILNRIEND